MNKKGFTLVELLATITIIGIICVIIFPSVNNLIKNNEKTTAEQIGNMIISATKKYVNDERLEGTGCLSVPAKKLIDFGYIETIDTGKLTCDINNSFVRIDFSSNKKEYSYHLSCNSNGNSKTFDTNNKMVSYCDDFVANAKGKIPTIKNLYAPDLGTRGENVDEYGLDSNGNTAVTSNSNLIPIRYNNGNWIVADVKNRKAGYYWYDYNNQMWANMAVVKNPEVYYKENTQQLNVGAVVDIDNILSMWVWIPRFSYELKYKGDNQLDNLSAKFAKIGNNSIKYCDDENVDLTYGRPTNCISPAFKDVDGKEKSGFWYAKYVVRSDESVLIDNNSYTYCDDTKINNVAVFINDTKEIKYKYNCLGVIEAFNKIKELEENLSSYYDMHLIRDIEATAVEALMYSKYGLNEVSQKNTLTEKISTTNNVYGVYDLDVYTYTTSYFNNISNQVYLNSGTDKKGRYDVNLANEEYNKYFIDESRNVESTPVEKKNTLDQIGYDKFNSNFSLNRLSFNMLSYDKANDYYYDFSVYNVLTEDIYNEYCKDASDPKLRVSIYEGIKIRNLIGYVEYSIARPNKNKQYYKWDFLGTGSSNTCKAFLNDLINEDEEINNIEYQYNTSDFEAKYYLRASLYILY